MKTRLRAAAFVCFALSLSTLSATVYLHRTFEQVLASSELIVKATVIKRLETGDHRKSCMVQVDEVLSGTLTADTVQVNRRYIRMGPPRADYRTSETLVFCLKPLAPGGHPWPQNVPSVPQYELVGSDAEGEFPIVAGSVWVRQAPFQKGETVKYADEELRVIKMPYKQFLRDIKSQVR